MYANNMYVVRVHEEEVPQNMDQNMEQNAMPPVDNNNLLTIVSRVEYVRNLSGTYIKTRILPQNWPAFSRQSSSLFDKVDQQIKDFEINWHDLSYIVERRPNPLLDHPLSPWSSSAGQPSFRLILKNLNGSIRSSQLTAIMGPSGSGKSTLLDCLFGRRTKGLSGDVVINGNNDVDVAIVTQDDYLTDKFTLREALLFASKVKNHTRSVVHQNVIFGVVNHLSLNSVLDTRLEKCSGGQRRRISIALELVSNPNILILDEPTSGLDSSSCYQLIQILRDLSQYRHMAIVATIHQPSATVFNMFDNIYVLSRKGRNIYNGEPGDLVKYLADVDVTVPEYYNPSDYILEIASGEYGEDLTQELAHVCQKSAETHRGRPSVVEMLANNMSKIRLRSKRFSVTDLFHLLRRCSVLTFREPQLFVVRIVSAIILSTLVGLLFGADGGQYGGCPMSLTKSAKSIEKETLAVQQNIAAIFINVMDSMLVGLMPMIMTFPKEFSTVKKQYMNGWYSSFSYYLSKTFIEIPLSLIVCTLSTTIWYVLSNQVHEWWRFAAYSASGVLITITVMSLGMICSALLARNPIAAGYLSIMALMPPLVFSGFFIRGRPIPSFLTVLNDLSFVKYSFESMIIAIYGYDRCARLQTQSQTGNSSAISGQSPFEAIELVTGYDFSANMGGNQSMVMSEFKLRDDMLGDNLYVLMMFAVVFQAIAYLMLLINLRRY